ncbi:hypothetical protein [Aquimarina spongiae]|uniref:Uncharacterized protein n=1 Tax=Aquimarina spongiae TaxID=570521 RepID=A0A1M6A2E7_9FLAO|nr:hypothetical protein [Aquimarina spongiae]SHI30636.1 hypothetical protein SAMN04488508_10137 [Aquimarina spongiae]
MTENPGLGNDFFKDYKVYLDFEDSKIYLVGYSKSVEEKVFNSFGLSYIVKDSSLKINTIIKGSSADKNQLKINYEILEIDYLTVSSEIKDNPCIFLKEIFNEKETILVKYKTPEGTKGSVVLKKEKLL